jgi:hypothetical protein
MWYGDARSIDSRSRNQRRVMHIRRAGRYLIHRRPACCLHRLMLLLNPVLRAITSNQGTN